MNWSKWYALTSVVLAGSASAWALNWQTLPGGRWAPLALPATGQTGFKLLGPAETGVAFTNHLAQARYTTNQILLNGSGVALGDVDGDGLCDIYLCSLDGANALYHNLGNWRFEEIALSAGVSCPNMASTSAALVDLDGDGDLDLVVSSIGQGTLIFFNDGKGHFTPSSQGPLNLHRGAMSMAFADIDGDGDLDLYIANYRTVTIRDQPNTSFRISTLGAKPTVTHVNGRPVTEPDLQNRFELDPNGKVLENGEPDALFLNDGAGHFTLAPFTGGRFLDETGQPLSEPPYDWGLSVMFRDMNGDNAPDLYVCNDFNSPDRIWINNGKGQFRAIPRLNFRTTPLFSMGLDFADLNRDGHDEILVLDMFSRDHRKRLNQLPDILPPVSHPGEFANRPQYSRNALFLNRGDMTYAEIGQFSGLAASGWSWCPVFLDVDLDGYEDVLIVTGNQRDSMNADVASGLMHEVGTRKLSVEQRLALLNRFPRLTLPKLAFRNRHDLTFEEVGGLWGFNQADVSQGIALADLDNDGDLDVVINNLNGQASLYRNESTAPRLAVRLKGLAPNTRGIGAKIQVLGGPVPQSQEVMAGGRYLSSDDPARVFAAGSSGSPLRIEVAWRSGKKSVIDNALPNRLYEVDESISLDRPPATLAAQGPTTPWFEDLSRLLNHRHHQDVFDDAARQPLLRRFLSQLGPGIAWSDCNRDGWDDLIVGSGAGGTLAVYLNDGHGGFQPFSGLPLAPPLRRDQSSILSWTGTTNTVVVAGSSNYQDGSPAGPVAHMYDLGSRSVDDGLPGQGASTGPMAIAELDDGVLALFVGGRVLPGRYPEPASSMLLLKKAGSWHVDTGCTQALRNLGLVSGAVWSDLDQDGLPELVLACEAGPVRVFRVEQGHLTELTAQLGLSGFVGLWNGVSTGDVDGDGRLDIVATNYGLNNQYQFDGGGDLRLYYGDFLGNGSIGVLEGYPDKAMDKIVPYSALAAVAQALPFVRERFASNEAFASASIDDLLGDRASTAKVLRVNTLASMVFLNRGDHFEPRLLPTEAQLAPAFGVAIGDLDGDGNEDLFLSQNFFDVAPETPRMDAGRGLWLRGDGHGGFKAVPGQESGIRVYGEQRGCALADFDGDGRVDLAVTQNGANTRLFRNLRAKPGLRVRLKGSPANPAGIGAVLQLVNEGQRGPAREVHAGSGYWSQDSAIQVLGFAARPQEIQVRWPGGKTTVSSLSPEARDIAVDQSGHLEIIR